MQGSIFRCGKIFCAVFDVCPGALLGHLFLGALDRAQKPALLSRCGGTNNLFNFRRFKHSPMKIFNLFFCIVFIFFAALQYNDPDPYVWVPIYGYAAVLCWLAFRNKYYPGALLLGMAVYFVYAVYKVFDQNGLIDWITKHHGENIAETMKAEKPWIEETREFFGLVILIVVLLIDYIYAKRKITKPTLPA